MNECSGPSVAVNRRAGRAYLFLGMLIAVAGIGIYVAQVQARILIAPWYVPILATAGVVFIGMALVRSRSVWRWLAAVLFTLLATGEWMMLLFLLRAPPYDGPVQVGRPFPAFTTTLADGSTITQESLKGDRNTVMVFFRGRW
jgi:hypothetical protein